MATKKKTYQDPVTGDQLTRSERVSWVIQGVIRNWLFLGIFTVITILVWATNNSTSLLWWNLSASYLAIVIESIVGIALFAQTKRDAVVIREVRTISQHVETIVGHLEEQDRMVQANLDSIMAALDRQNKAYDIDHATLVNALLRHDTVHREDRILLLDIKQLAEIRRRRSPSPHNKTDEHIAAASE